MYGGWLLLMYRLALLISQNGISFLFRIGNTGNFGIDFDIHEKVLYNPDFIFYSICMEISCSYYLTGLVLDNLPIQECIVQVLISLVKFNMHLLFVILSH